GARGRALAAAPHGRLAGARGDPEGARRADPRPARDHAVGAPRVHLGDPLDARADPPAAPLLPEGRGDRRADALDPRPRRPARAAGGIAGAAPAPAEMDPGGLRRYRPRAPAGGAGALRRRRGALAANPASRRAFLTAAGRAFRRDTIGPLAGS